MTDPTTLDPVQQSQPQTYNHPCGDLLDCGKRREYLDCCVSLYRASIQVDWKAASVILKGHPDLVRSSITEYKDTPLHIASAAENPRSAESIKFVRRLVEMMEKDDLKLQNQDGNTALCIAAIAGGVEMARIMVSKNPELLKVCGSDNMMPLHLAASHGNSEMVRYLYEHYRGMPSADWTYDERNVVFLKCIEADIFDVALRILDDNQDLQFPQEKHLCDILNILARKTKAFPSPKEPNLISRAISLVSDSITREAASTLLLRKIWKKIVEKPKDEIDAILKGPMIKIADGIKTYPSPTIFVAAEKGNMWFLVELFKEYPELVLKTNEDGHTIFHIAALHRHENIYAMLFNIGPMKDRVIQFVDKKGNNMLHLAAILDAGSKQETMRGSALLLQCELLWFKEVKAMIAPRFIEMKNAEGLTPIEVFTLHHKDLISKMKKWMKETTNECMVVAALVTTIGFAVVFTIPGGYNPEMGVPLFNEYTPFIVFLTMNAISYISSSVSILMFLSLVISPYAQRDFIESIPNEMIMGLATLFIAICTLIVTFSSSFFILYKYTIAIPLSILSCVPVILILVIEYPVLHDMIRSKYSSRYLFNVRHTL